MSTRQEKEYSPKRGIKSSKEGWGCISMVKYLNSMYKALDSLSSTGRKKKHTYNQASNGRKDREGTLVFNLKLKEFKDISSKNL